MKRGEVYDARLEPVEGSEQGGTRPVIITFCTKTPVEQRPTKLLDKCVKLSKLSMIVDD